jgi:hypothetical protein
MNPTRISSTSCIVFSPNASHFNFKPDIIQLLPSFHGLDLENPYLHLKEFEEVYNTYNDLNCTMNTIRLKLFSFLLKDKAKTWLQFDNCFYHCLILTLILNFKDLFNYLLYYIYIYIYIYIICNLYSWPSCGSTPVLPDYLLL